MNLDLTATPGLAQYLGLAAILFCTGFVGVLFKRNAISLFMCVELMVNAANLAFVAFAWHYSAVDGIAIVFFTMTVAAAEAAVGLAIILALFRRHGHVELERLTLLQDSAQP